MYNLQVGGVYPLRLDYEGIKVIRTIADGSYIVQFNSLQNYVNAFRKIAKENASIVREEDYPRFVKQYATIAEVTDVEEKVYAKPSNEFWLKDKGTVLQIDIYYTTGFYTTTYMELDGYSYNERRDSYHMRDIWLQQQGTSFDYCKRQTENIDSIVAHLSDIHNTASGQLQLFKTVIDANKAKGFGMCLYKISYMYTSLTTKAFAKKPEDLFSGLLEEHKDKVYGLETIGFGLDNMVEGNFYKVVFVNNTEFEFMYRGAQHFGRMMSPHIKAGKAFRVEEL